MYMVVIKHPQYYTAYQSNLILLKDEIRTLTAMYHRRIAEKEQTLITDSNRESVPKYKLSRIIFGIIKDVAGLNYLTAHNFRHSCLTNLQVTRFLKYFDFPH